MANILCIEPDMILARTYVQALQHAGHVARHAHSAQEAIDAIDDNVPDIVVLELRLTVHDGIEFLQEFRSYPEWQNIPVILLTTAAITTLAPLQQALQKDLGVVAYLYKPQTSLQQLISTIHQQTGGRS